VKKGVPDYTSHYTFNDDVIWENINFLTQSYLTLGQQRLLDPIQRGMEFYLASLQGNPQRGWGAQHGMDLKPAQARTFEPVALAPSYTLNNAMHLIRFYEWTGDRKFIAPIPDILNWLENARLPKEQTENGTYTHPTWVEIGTGKPLYAHRRGSNRLYGEYYMDYSDEKVITHYGQKSNLDNRIKTLRKEYERVNALSPKEATVNSPLKPSRFEGDGSDSTPQNYYYLNRTSFDEIPGDSEVREIINGLDEQHRWLVKHARTSQPFIGLEDAQEELTDEYCCAHPGDITDTTPFNDPTDQNYISTREYITNMNLLMNYISNN
ncbi:MAG: pectate lyase, partial [Balneolales bacterium]